MNAFKTNHLFFSITKIYGLSLKLKNFATEPYGVPLWQAHEVNPLKDVILYAVFSMPDRLFLIETLKKLWEERGVKTDTN